MIGPKFRPVVGGLLTMRVCGFVMPVAGDPASLYLDLMKRVLTRRRSASGIADDQMGVDAERAGTGPDETERRVGSDVVRGLSTV